MFSLDSLSGAPISGYFLFDTSNTVSGLQANAILNSVITDPSVVVGITGVSATAYLNIGDGTNTFPLRWRTINTAQYPIS